jgi:hypothetical protein
VCLLVFRRRAGGVPELIGGGVETVHPAVEVSQCVVRAVVIGTEVDGGLQRALRLLELAGVAGDNSQRDERSRGLGASHGLPVGLELEFAVTADAVELSKHQVRICRRVIEADGVLGLSDRPLLPVLVPRLLEETDEGLCQRNVGGKIGGVFLDCPLE